MSNKTSDENVANIEIIENFIFELKSFGLNKDTLEVANELENLLSDYTRQKQINEEHKKINGELREKVKELEEENKNLKAQHIFTRNNNATDKEKAELYDVIDKTIDTFLEQEKPIWQQEMTTNKMSLEEALSIVDEMCQDRYKIIEKNNTIYVDKLNDIKFTNLEFASVRLLREVQSLQYKLENSIPKQVVKDKIEELMIQGNYKTFYNPNGRTHFLKEESDCKIEVLQELLEGEKNNENIKS